MQEINITQFLEVSPNGIIKGVKKNPINPYKESSEEKALRELLNNKNVADFLFIIGNHHTKSIAEGAFSNVFGLTRQPKGIMLGDIIQDNKWAKFNVKINPTITKITAGSFIDCTGIKNMYFDNVPEIINAPLNGIPSIFEYRNTEMNSWYVPNVCFDKNILDATDALFNDFDLNKVTHPKIEHHEGYSSYISQGNNGNSDLDKAGVKWIEFEKNKEKTMVDLTGFDIEHTKFCATKNIKLKELTVQNIKNPEWQTTTTNNGVIVNFKKYAEFFGYNNSKFGVSTMEVLFHNRQHPTSAMNKIIFENCENIIIPVWPNSCVKEIELVNCKNVMFKTGMWSLDKGEAMNIIIKNSTNCEVVDTGVNDYDSKPDINIKRINTTKQK